MPRTIDPQRFTARQTAILAAAYRCFGTAGYETTSTADVCRAARISSGTLFHYFPTKIDILSTLLRVSAAWTEEQLRLAGRARPGREALTAYFAAVEREQAAEHARGFARAVHGTEYLPAVSEVLDLERELIDHFLLEHVTEALRTGAARSTASPGQLVGWIRWLTEGSALHAPPTTPGSGLSAAVRGLLGLG